MTGEEGRKEEVQSARQRRRRRERKQGREERKFTDRETREEVEGRQRGWEEEE